ncbi:MAG: type II toxin-antitoxin system RelE/ParE family toxin [Pirellulales bacterium]
MSLRVVLSARAKRELLAATQWWADNRSLEQAERWYAGFLKALQGLRDTAARHPLARESSRFSLELRQINYGVRRQPTHRAVYLVQESDVVVLAIRHLAQRDLTREEVTERG